MGSDVTTPAAAPATATLGFSPPDLTQPVSTDEYGRPVSPPPETPEAEPAPPPAAPGSYRPGPKGRWAPAAVGGALIGVLAVFAVVVLPFTNVASSLPVSLGPNEVTNWSNYNYKGYEGQTSYPEYHAIMTTMDAVSKRYGCGREMWEYSASENRFGTPEALMLLPYWTNGCIDSMEGLLFESSTTTPYHFINQAELSQAPSDPEVGLPYGPVDVTLGVQHLQLLGVKYFMAETPEVEQQANADPALKLVAKTGPWTYSYAGADATTTWNIYVVKNAPLVTPLANDPVVLSGVKPAPSSWLKPSLAWYDDPSRWNVELAQDGPSSWPRTPVDHIAPTVKHVGTTQVSDISQTDTSVSFPRLAGGDARPGQGVLLPQLARQRCRRSLAGDPQPHGGGPDEPRRHPELRRVVRRRPRSARHAGRPGRTRSPLRRADASTMVVAPALAPAGPRPRVPARLSGSPPIARWPIPGPPPRGVVSDARVPAATSVLTRAYAPERTGRTFASGTKGTQSV